MWCMLILLLSDTTSIHMKPLGTDYHDDSYLTTTADDMQMTCNERMEPRNISDGGQEQYYKPNYGYQWRERMREIPIGTHEYTCENANDYNIHSILTSSLMQNPPIKIIFINSSIKRFPLTILFHTEKFDNLEFLEFRNSHIEDIAPRTFLGLFHLKHLDLSENSVKNLQPGVFLGLENLKTMILSNNLIGDILDHGNLTGLIFLEILYLDHNLISTIKASAFDQFLHLKELYLDKNVLTVLAANLFSKLPELHTLSLQKNKLSSIDNNTFIVQNPTGLRLDLSQNQLQELLPGMFGLSDNSTLHIDRLDFSYNNIRNTNGLIFEATFCSFEHNELETTPEGAYGTSVVLKNNYLKVLKHIKFYSDSHSTLDASYNLITEFQNITGEYLSAFSLTHNNISTLAPGQFHTLSNLLILELDDNRISNLPFGVFNGLVYLQSLNLSRNFLTTIESGIFYPLKELQTLLLNDNKLKIIDVNYLITNVKNLKSIGISDNLWNCKILYKVVVDLERRHISIIHNDEKAVHEVNIEGNACSEDDATFSEDNITKFELKTTVLTQKSTERHWTTSVPVKTTRVTTDIATANIVTVHEVSTAMEKATTSANVEKITNANRKTTQRTTAATSATPENASTDKNISFGVRNDRYQSKNEMLQDEQVIDNINELKHDLVNLKEVVIVFLSMISILVMIFVIVNYRKKLSEIAEQRFRERNSAQNIISDNDL